MLVPPLARRREKAEAPFPLAVAGVAADALHEEAAGPSGLTPDSRPPPERTRPTRRPAGLAGERRGPHPLDWYQLQASGPTRGGRAVHECRQVLGGLIRKSVGCSFVDACARRVVFDLMAFEATVGQLPNSTVVSVTRRTDGARAARCPIFTATLTELHGYQPCECNHDANEAPRFLVNGRDLVARISLRGPASATQFIESDGSVDLMGMCYQATVWRWQVCFTGVGDSSMVRSVALGVLAALAALDTIPRKPAPLIGELHKARIMGGHVGLYSDVFEHAMEWKTSRLPERLRKIRDGEPVCENSLLDEALIQPWINLNTDILCAFATPSAFAVHTEAVF
ncbi:unnamed protein product [Prorocentrum cordatum]|uniref:Uncharacterized protein n=1 Tax=Prorocentrum cordatum TaxID=2364126 RepID=A0ABN9VC75_9DINO|nr:unnamed protein product [Polarella glacialis]